MTCRWERLTRFRRLKKSLSSALWRNLLNQAGCAFYASKRKQEEPQKGTKDTKKLATEGTGFREKNHFSKTSLPSVAKNLFLF
jgi:hypothetical protein